MKSCKEALVDVLDANNEITYSKARNLLKDKYELDLSRSNFDKIKCVRRKSKKGKNITKKIKKGSQGVVLKNPSSVPPTTDSFNKIDATTVETLMLKQANEGNDTVPFIRCIVDYLKIKGDSVELDEDLDLEVLRQIGINLKNSN